MHPPSQIAPVAALSVLIGKPRDHNRGTSPHPPRAVALVPDMARIIRLVSRAFQVMRIAEVIDRRAPVSRSHRNRPEGFDQWVQQVQAKRAPRLQEQVRILGQVLHGVEIADLGIEEIAREKVP